MHYLGKKVISKHSNFLQKAIYLAGILSRFWSLSYCFRWGNFNYYYISVQQKYWICACEKLNFYVVFSTFA